MEAFLERYRSRLLPDWLAHRVSDAVEVVKACEGLDVAEAGQMMAALCGFIAWVDADVALRDSLTRSRLRAWSLDVLQGRLSPGTHDHRLRHLKVALDVFEGVYRPRPLGPRARKGWASDGEIARVVELAGVHAHRRALVAAAAGAGMLAGDHDVVLTPTSHGVIATSAGVSRRVLPEFESLVPHPVVVTRSTAVNFSAVLGHHGLRQVPTRLRRAWRRRWLTMDTPAVMVCAALRMSDQVIEDVLTDLDLPSWDIVASMLRDAPSTGRPS